MEQTKYFLRFEEAVELYLTHWPQRAGVEKVRTAEAWHRVTAESYSAKTSIPVVRASGMDGVAFTFARWKEEDPHTWRLGEDFVRADTGDDFPDVFDTVLPIEAVRIGTKGQGLEVLNPQEVKYGMNIRPSGSLVQKGTPIVKAGTCLEASDLAGLAMGNVSEIYVRKKPVVAFIPTGNELVSLGSILQRGQNIDANSLLVEHLLRSFGAEPRMFPIVPDRPEEIWATVCKAQEEADLVLVNGGSSKGEDDFAVRLQAEYGRLLFHWSEAGPGRPVALASVRNRPVVVVPGPVYGCFNVMHWFLYPIIRYLLQVQGGLYPCVRAVLEENPDNPPDFRSLYGVQLIAVDEGYKAKLLNFKKDGTLACLTADGFLHTQPGSPWKAGDEVTVYLLRCIH